MKNILAFAGSNSLNSINKKLIQYTSIHIESKVDIINLSDFEVPMYGIDHENDNGIPQGTKQLNEKIKEYELLIISVNEHNGGASAFFKNHIDWLSRNDMNFLKDKKLLLLSTSPGRGGAKMALTWTANVLPRFGAEVISQFSFASFNHAYSSEKGIYDKEQKLAFDKALQTFLDQIR